VIREVVLVVRREGVLEPAGYAHVVLVVELILRVGVGKRGPQ
jgi:hypothetical protein